MLLLLETEKLEIHFKGYLIVPALINSKNPLELLVQLFFEAGAVVGTDALKQFLCVFGLVILSYADLIILLKKVLMHLKKHACTSQHPLH